MLDQYNNWLPDPISVTPMLPQSLSNYIDYAGPPTLTPPAIQNIVVDKNGRQWEFWPATNGAWH